MRMDLWFQAFQQLLGRLHFRVIPELFHPLLHPFHFFLLFLIIEAKLGKITLCVFVPRIIKKRHEFIVLFEMEGVIGMAMTLYAGKSSALLYFPARVNPVNDRRHTVLFSVNRKSTV